MRQRFETMSGIPLEPVYDPEVAELPGQYPYTRGPYASVYRSRLWTMRQFAGFGTLLVRRESTTICRQCPSSMPRNPRSDAVRRHISFEPRRASRTRLPIQLPNYVAKFGQ